MTSLADIVARGGESIQRIMAQRQDSNDQTFGSIRQILANRRQDKIEAPIRAAKLAEEAQQREIGGLQLQNMRKQQSDQTRREAAMRLPHREEALAALNGDPKGQEDLVKSFDAVDKYKAGLFGEIGFQLKRNKFSPPAIDAAAKEAISIGFDPQKIQAMIGDLDSLRTQVDSWLIDSPNTKHQAAGASDPIGFQPEGATPVNMRTGLPIPGAKVGTKVRSIDEQSLVSFAKSLGYVNHDGIGDASQMTPTDFSKFQRQEAEAKHIVDPNTAALLAIRLDEERKKVEQQKNPFGIASDFYSTDDGKKYIDLGQYKGDEKKAEAEARAAGIIPLPAKDAASVRQVVNAKLTMQNIFDQIESKLPKDATGRVTTGPENKLSKFFQTDADIAAFDSYVRNAAIPQIQAMASGGTGNRIQKSEIDNMISAMPTTSDTVSVAMNKKANFISTVQRIQDGFLVKDRSKLSSVPDDKKKEPIW